MSYQYQGGMLHASLARVIEFESQRRAERIQKAEERRARRKARTAQLVGLGVGATVGVATGGMGLPFALAAGSAAAQTTTGLMQGDPGALTKGLAGAEAMMSMVSTYTTAEADLTGLGVGGSMQAGHTTAVSQKTNALGASMLLPPPPPLTLSGAPRSRPASEGPPPAIGVLWGDDRESELRLQRLAH